MTPANTGDRTLSVLQLFTLEEPEWDIDAAATRLEVSYSTAYRYFRSLCSAGLLDTLSGGRYVLGPAFIVYDRQIRMLDPVLQAAQPAMRRLVAYSGGEGVALLCRRYGNEVLCVHQEYQGMPDSVVSYERGRPMGLFRGAASKMILANLKPATLRKLFDANGPDIAGANLGQDWDAFRATLRRIRSAGVCISHAELDADRVGVSAPVFGPDGMIVGSVSLVIREETSTSALIANTAALVMAAGREIGAGLADPVPDEALASA